MSHQDAKAIAQQVIRDLLAKYHPGLVVMVLRSLHRIQHRTPDITIYAEPQKPDATRLPAHPPREETTNSSSFQKV
jgi:hypothetical protein